MRLKSKMVLKNFVDCSKLLSSKLHIGSSFAGVYVFSSCTLIGESLHGKKKVSKDVSQSRLSIMPIHQCYSCRISFHKRLSFRS